MMTTMIFGDFETLAGVYVFGDFDGPVHDSLPADNISGHLKTLSISDAFEGLITEDTSMAQHGDSRVHHAVDEDENNDLGALKQPLPLMDLETLTGLHKMYWPLKISTATYKMIIAKGGCNRVSSAAIEDR
jgi:hypothetical protein